MVNKLIHGNLFKLILGCLVVATVVCTNGIAVNALEINNITKNTSTNQSLSQQKHEFLIDSNVKAYSGINRLKKVSDFDFKLLDYVVKDNKPSSYQLIKTSDVSNAVEVFFDNSSSMSNNNNIALKIFKGDPVDSLEKIEENHGAIKDGYTVDIASEDIKIGNVNGKNINITINVPGETKGNIDFKETKHIEKNFAWEDNNITYVIQYGESYISEDGNTTITDISQGELEKMVDSLKELSEIKNVDYSGEKQKLSTECELVGIYDEDDLKEAENTLGNKLKILLNSKDNINISSCSLGITSDSDIENNKINYELNSFYNKNNTRISLNQSNHDDFGRFNEAKNNGYLASEKVKVEKRNINGTEVYVYREKYDDKVFDNDIVYLWQDDGMYYKITFINTDEYQDNIVKEFIDA